MCSKNFALSHLTSQFFQYRYYEVHTGIALIVTAIQIVALSILLNWGFRKNRQIVYTHIRFILFFFPK